MSVINIAVFAHNEQDNIIRCLQSVCDSISDKSLLNVKVLVNGSSDATLELVGEFCNQNSEFSLVEIKLGDKSNAWNEYIYSELGNDEPRYFLDGDCWLPALSMNNITDQWDHSAFNAVAVLPIGVSEGLRDMLRDNSWISGAFYGLSPEFIKLVKARKFRIPIGFIGEDSLITYLLEEGFDGSRKSQLSSGWKKLVAVVESTGPIIPKESISIASMKMFHTRYKRYALRHFQQEIFYYLARGNRIDELPEQACELKMYLKEIGIRPFIKIVGLQTAYHPYALYKMLTAKPMQN